MIEKQNWKEWKPWTHKRKLRRRTSLRKNGSDTIFDKLSESERENEKDKADIIAQKEKLNELDTTKELKSFHAK